MLFLSSILGATLRDQADQMVGKVNDLVVVAEKGRGFPPVKGVVVLLKKTKEKKYVAAENIESWSRKEVVAKNQKEYILSELPNNKNFVYLKKNILDRQIVDLEGMRVVRVNDLQLGQVHSVMSLVAIDVSNRGLLRRIGLTNWRLFNFLKPNLLEWKGISIVGDKLQLAKGADELVKLHPADIANIIENLNVRQGSILLQTLDQETAAHVLEEIQPDIKKILVKNLGAERTTAIMGKMSVDELVDLIQLLPSLESKELINKLPLDKKTQKVKKILEYDEDKAGGLMTTEYISALPDTKVEVVVEEIKKVTDSYRSLHFVYIQNKDGKFLGVASLRRLIAADKNKTMREIMKRIKRAPVVHVNQNLTDIATLMTKYNLMSVAVVDKDRKMLGIVTVDDIMRRLIPKA